MTQSPIELHRKVLNMKIVGLRFLGIWSLNPSSSSYMKSLYYIYSKFAFAIILIFVGTLAADLILNYKDILTVTDDGCFLAGISVIVFKLYVYQSRHKRIFKLVEDIHQPAGVLSKSSDFEVLMAVRSCIFYENISGKFFITLGSALAIILIFFVPKEEGALPIRASFPFDISTSPMHELAFSIQAFSISYGLMTIVFMDELIITLIKWINVHLSVLGCNYENCRPNYAARATFTSNNHINTINRNNMTKSEEDQIKINSYVLFDNQEIEEVNDSFIWRFKTCSKHHQKFIDIVDEINEIFGSSMLMQLFSSFSMICLTAFQAALGTGGLQSLMKFVVYLSAACSQLLNWCWVGNELLYQSAALTTSQWFCGWEDELIFGVKPFMLISLLRSKYSLQLKAGKFYNMSLQTFISVLRNSYSFFTLLSHVTVDT